MSLPRNCDGHRLAPLGNSLRLSNVSSGANSVSMPSTIGRSLVILPTYNERENLERIVAAILDQAADLDVLIVDDNSPDGTGAIAERLGGASNGRVHVLHRSGKLGLGTAYIEGFLWGLAREYAYLFEMDADFSHNPADLVRLRAA